MVLGSNNHHPKVSWFPEASVIHLKSKLSPFFDRCTPLNYMMNIKIFLQNLEEMFIKLQDKREKLIYFGFSSISEILFSVSMMKLYSISVYTLQISLLDNDFIKFLISTDPSLLGFSTSMKQLSTVILPPPNA